MTGPERPFDAGRARPIVTALDTLRRRVDHDGFDAAVFSLDSIVADLGYGDVRPLPGSIAWIDSLRRKGKQVAVSASGERATTALELAGIADRVDVIITGSHPGRRVARALEQLGVEPDRAVVAGVAPDDVAAARAEGVELVIGIARGHGSPEQLRRAGAVTVVADLRELLGPTAA